jgi:D-beta-D-heptose 7-phosphate kinase/D-beta-D-heptose 1-phosphate adenosyltransferase
VKRSAAPVFAAASARKRVASAAALTRRLAAARRRGRRVVFTNGCFDLLHAGHVRYLERARRLGDLLVVAVNSDASVRRLKGPGRPVLPLGERLAVLGALEAVDFVVPFGGDTPAAVIRTLRPDVLVKGADWPLGRIVGRREVWAGGGRVRRIPMLSRLSTTRIIRRILSSGGGRRGRLRSR